MNFSRSESLSRDTEIPSSGHLKSREQRAQHLPRRNEHQVEVKTLPYTRGQEVQMTNVSWGDAAQFLSAAAGEVSSASADGVASASSYISEGAQGVGSFVGKHPIAGPAVMFAGWKAFQWTKGIIGNAARAVFIGPALFFGALAHGVEGAVRRTLFGEEGLAPWEHRD